MKYTIYLRTNNKNGKHYVGQTNNFKNREYQWHTLKTTYANKYIDSDREQYGIDNFSTEILAECDTREEAWNLEQYYIKHYKTIYPNGYNLAKGGSGNSSTPSEESRKKMSEARKGKQINRQDQSKKVYQYSLDWKLVKVWESTRECDRNGFKQGAVSACCRNCYSREGNNIYKGYRWSF